MSQKPGELPATDVTLNTQSGREITPLRPEAAQITVEDIASGTARVCRCSGQTEHFYSVALHSIYVSEDLDRTGHPPRTQLLGLLHDAAEAYIADVPGPVKTQLPRYREIEEGIQEAVHEAFDLEPPTRAEAAAIEAADTRLRRYELPTLLPETDWEFDRVDLGYDLTADSSTDVAATFTERAGTLADATDGVP